MHRFTILLGISLFMLINCSAKDCPGQRRGWLKRQARIQTSETQTTIHPPSQVQADENQPTVVVPADQFDAPAPRFFSRHRPAPPARFLYDPRSPYFDSTTPFPKYWGGFHASEIHNLGVPTGDRGFRGNGIYWSPW